MWNHYKTWFLYEKLVDRWNTFQSVCWKKGTSVRTERNYCVMGKIECAFLTGKTRNISSEAVLHKRNKKKVSPQLATLREKKESRWNIEEYFINTYPMCIQHRLHQTNQAGLDASCVFFPTQNMLADRKLPSSRREDLPTFLPNPLG